MLTLVPKVSALLEKTLTVKQVKQIQAVVLINSLNYLERLVLHRLLNSSCSYSKDTSRYVELFLQHMQNPDVSLWVYNMRFLSKHGQFVEAFAQYVNMRRSGLLPSTFAVSSALKACARLKDLWGGISVHGQIHKYEFSDDVYVQTALVDFYSKLNDIETSRKVFDDMKRKNVVSWNSLLIGYLKNGNLSMAQSFFDEIPEKDVLSWNSMITGYLRTGNIDHAYSLFQKMPERNTASWNAIIGGYVKCGKIELARAFYDLMPKRNNVSCITMIAGYSRCGNVESANEMFCKMDEKDQVLYNAMIACFSQNSRPREALQLFNDMIQPHTNIQPDKMTLSSVISACSQLGDLSFGVWTESYMRKLGIRMDDHLATAFIDLWDDAKRLQTAIHDTAMEKGMAKISGSSWMVGEITTLNIDDHEEERLLDDKSLFLQQNLQEAKQWQLSTRHMKNGASFRLKTMGLTSRIQRSLATDLQSLSMELREKQSTYLERLKQQKEDCTVRTGLI
ncbi:hypothetical protein ACET3Z_031080 [Daucus carota]